MLGEIEVYTRKPGWILRQICVSLDGLTATQFNWRPSASANLRGTGAPREISRREALVESIRHGALHVGELRLTRDLAAKRRGCQRARRLPDLPRGYQNRARQRRSKKPICNPPSHSASRLPCITRDSAVRNHSVPNARLSGSSILSGLVQQSLRQGDQVRRAAAPNNAAERSRTRTRHPLTTAAPRWHNPAGS
jgi:hypothetical protein